MHNQCSLMASYGGGLQRFPFKGFNYHENFFVITLTYWKLQTILEHVK